MAVALVVVLLGVALAFVIVATAKNIETTHILGIIASFMPKNVICGRNDGDWDVESVGSFHCKTAGLLSRNGDGLFNEEISLPSITPNKYKNSLVNPQADLCTSSTPYAKAYSSNPVTPNQAKLSAKAHRDPPSPVMRLRLETILEGQRLMLDEPVKRNPGSRAWPLSGQSGYAYL